MRNCLGLMILIFSILAVGLQVTGEGFSLEPSHESVAQEVPFEESLEAEVDDEVFTPATPPLTLLFDKRAHVLFQESDNNIDYEPSRRPPRI